MSVVDFFKSREKLAQSLRPVELKRRLEPQWRELQSKMSKHLAGSLDGPWFDRLSVILDRDTHKVQELSPAVRAGYQFWQSLVGQEIYVGDWYQLNQAVIDQFAQATGDTQWIHVDQERAARESPFGTTIAHGFLTLALLPQLTGSLENTNSLYANARMVVNQGLNKVRFPSAVKSGAQLRAHTRLLSVVPGRKYLELVQEVSIEIEGSPRLACIAETLVRIYL